MTPRGRPAFALAALLLALFATTGSVAAPRADALKSEVELSTRDVGSKETVLGDLVADAVHSAVKSDAAFVAADYFNDVSINRGPFTTSDVMKALVMPGDTIAVVKLTGEQIQRGLERSLFLYPKFNSGFLQVSGIVVTFRPDADADKRVVSVKIGGESLEPGRVYRVAMPTPLAKGGLAYFKIWKAADIDKETAQTLQTSIVSYLSDHRTISKGEERLVAKAR